MQDSSLMSNDQMYQQALDSIEKEIQDMETAELAAAQLGKGLGDYDLSVATAKVRQARIANERNLKEKRSALIQQVPFMEENKG